MNAKDFKRKLTAVFSADVAGYSRLMGEDETATVKTLGLERHHSSPKRFDKRSFSGNPVDKFFAVMFSTHQYTGTNEYRRA